MSCCRSRRHGYRAHARNRDSRNARVHGAGAGARRRSARRARRHLRAGLRRALALDGQLVFSADTAQVSFCSISRRRRRRRPRAPSFRCRPHAITSYWHVSPRTPVTGRHRRAICRSSSTPSTACLPGTKSAAASGGNAIARPPPRSELWTVRKGGLCYSCAEYRFTPTR